MTADIGNDAVGAVIVAAEHNVDAGFIGVLALYGKILNNLVRGIPDLCDLVTFGIKASVFRLVYLAEVLRKAEQVMRSENKIHIRVALFNLFYRALFLRHTAADGNLHIGTVLFKVCGAAQTPEEVLIGIVTDRTGVVDDKIRRFRLNLLESGIPENAGKLLRIPGIHLTAEVLHVKGRCSAKDACKLRRINLRLFQVFLLPCKLFLRCLSALTFRALCRHGDSWFYSGFSQVRILHICSVSLSVFRRREPFPRQQRIHSGCGSCIRL